MNKHLHVLLGALLGVLLGFTLGRHYGMRVQGEVDRTAYQARAKVDVIAARRDIPAGTTLERRDLARMEVPADTISEHIMPGDAGRLVGRATVVPINLGQPISWGDIHADTSTNSR